MSNAHVTPVYELDLPPTSRAVLLALANRADARGYCFPSQARIAREIGFSARTVQSHVKVEGRSCGGPETHDQQHRSAVGLLAVLAGA